MNTKFATTLIFMHFCLMLISQNPTSSCPPNYISNATSIPLPTNTNYNDYNNAPAIGSSCGLAKSFGPLDFFVNDGIIYDEDGTFIDFAFTDDPQDYSGIWDPITGEYCYLYDVSSGFATTTGQETTIIPMPNCKQYLIISSLSSFWNFTTFDDLPDPLLEPDANYFRNAYPVYCIFDSEQNIVIQRGTWFGPIEEYEEILINPSATTPIFTNATFSNPSQTNGDIALTTQEVETIFKNYGNTNGLNAMAATDLQPDGSRFLISVVANMIFILKLESNGNLRYWKRHEIIFNGYKARGGECELVFNPNKDKFQFAFLEGDFSQDITYLEFSTDFLTLSNLHTISLPYSINTGFYGASGLEFSPNNEFLYFTNNIFSSQNTPLPPIGKFGYVDLVNFNYNYFPNSNLDIFNGSFIETTTNGNFYISSPYGLHLITNPNNPSTVTFSSTPTIPIQIYGTRGALSKTIENTFNTIYYPLPDQIDQMDYSLHYFINPECCVKNNAYSQESFSAEESAIWKPNGSGGSNPLTTTNSSEITIKDELRIQAGKSITIEDMTIKFAPGAKLIIENGSTGNQGGKLILKNTLLTLDNRCGSDLMWLGVEVWGNQNQTQGHVGNTSQGVLRLYNGSKIEHAKIGVLLSKRNPTNPNSYLDAFNGGIIQANQNSEFYNNKTSVYFRKHSSPSGANNLSYFTQTSFTWDGVLKENALPNDHIKMDQVKGIKITGCTFNQETPEIYSITQRGYGINAFMSQFYVDKYCQQLIIGQPCSNSSPTEFNDLNYGVLAYYGTTPLSFSVNESEFNNCRYGIYSSRSESARITKNTFNILEENSQSAGCIMHFSNGFKIEENSFQEQDNPLVAQGNGQSYGVIIHNAGIADNEVYKNTFSNLKVGGQSERLNGSQFLLNQHQTSGLEWVCNQFIAPIYQTDLGVNGVIGHYQGSFDQSSAANAQSHAARNTFSLASSTGTEHDIMIFNYNPPHDVYPNQQSIIYVQLDEQFHIANDIDALVNPHFAQYNAMSVAPFGTTCPSKIRTVGGTKPLLVSLKSDIDSLSNKIDGGDTEALLIAITDRPDASATKSLLLSASPYLSDNVLLYYLNNCSDNRYVKDVFIANSQLTSTVYEAMLSSSLPIATKNAITLAQENDSERESLYHLINWTEAEYKNVYDDYKSLLLLDTTELASFSPLMDELEKIDELQAKLDLYLIAVELQNETLASDLRGEIDTEIDGDFFKIIDATIALQDFDSYEVGLLENPTIANDLLALSENSSWFYGESAAKNILSCLGELEEIPEFLPLVSPSSMIIGGQNSNDNTSSKYELLALQVSIYPNPSSGKVYFDLPNENEGTLSIQLVDITGKEVYFSQFDQTNGQLVDLSHLKKGTYIVKVTLGESYSESQLLQLKD